MSAAFVKWVAKFWSKSASDTLKIHVPQHRLPSFHPWSCACFTIIGVVILVHIALTRPNMVYIRMTFFWPSQSGSISIECTSITAPSQSFIAGSACTGLMLISRVRIGMLIEFKYRVILRQPIAKLIKPRLLTQELQPTGLCRRT